MVTVVFLIVSIIYSLSWSGIIPKFGLTTCSMRVVWHGCMIAGALVRVNVIEDEVVGPFNQPALRYVLLVYLIRTNVF